MTPANAPPPLYRPQARARAASSWIGTITVRAPASHYLFAWSATLFALTLAAFLIFGRYTSHLKARGTLVPRGGVLSIRAPLTGTATHLLVHLGQDVTAGRPLLTVSQRPFSPALGPVDRIIRGSLAEERRLLIRDIQRDASLAAIQRKTLQDRLRYLRAQYAQTRRELRIRAQDIVDTKRVLKDFLSVRARGLVSDPILEQQRLAVLNAHAQWAHVARERQALADKLRATRHELMALPLTRARHESHAKARLQAIRRAIAQTSARHTLTVLAPRSGVIANLAVHAGQAVTEGRTLLTIVGRHDALMARLLVPATAVSFLHPGSPVLLHYAAFPYQEFGAFHGTVKSVSYSALTRSESRRVAWRPGTEPLYPVQVALRRTVITVNGQRRPLRPGMPVTAEIPLSRQRLFQWAINSIYGPLPAHHKGANRPPRAIRAAASATPASTAAMPSLPGSRP